MPATEAAARDFLAGAVREAGSIARAGFEGAPKVWEKSKGNPVTETDLAVDLFLRTRLCDAFPDHGWLSEESSESPDRLLKRRVFVVDPIDGTLAFIRRLPEFTICAAIVEDGAPVAAAIFNPMTEEMFTAARGAGATLNGRRIQVSDRTQLEGCRFLVARDVIEHPAWPRRWPAMELGKRSSIAYRMALVANGTYDAMMALSTKHEWDTAAGTLIVQEAGGVVSAHTGRTLDYNQEKPVHRSIVCGGRMLHAAIMDRTSSIPLP